MHALILLFALAPQDLSMSHEAATQPSTRRPDDKFEVWVQPLMTTVLAAASGGRDWYVSGGVTARLGTDWDLVAGVTFANGGAATGETSATGWQVWFSAAPVRFWHFAGRTARTGFFIGPKLTVEIAHIGDLSDYDLPYPSTTSLALEVGIEAGFRFQFKHFALTLSLPSVDVGYGWNQSGAVSLAFSDAFGSGGVPQKGSNGFVTDLDANLLRLGVSF